MRTLHADEGQPLVSLTDITEIELLVLRRMGELSLGDHRSRAAGSGFEFVGLRDWQPGDRFSAVDWPQSTMTGFSPLVVREFEQPSTASVVMVADTSRSTRCGVAGAPVAATIARTIATLGLSAVFFQDPVGLVTFGDDLRPHAATRPRIGKPQVIQCLDGYQSGRGLQALRDAGSFSATVGSLLRRAGLVPVISDFLIDDPRTLLRELSLLNAVHDVFLVMVDAAAAYTMPAIAAGWIEAFDVESGRTQLLSRRALARLASRVSRWQEEVAALAREADLDLVRISGDARADDLALTRFMAERRLRRAA